MLIERLLIEIKVYFYWPCVHEIAENIPWVVGLPYYENEINVISALLRVVMTEFVQNHLHPIESQIKQHRIVSILCEYKSS